MRLTIGIHAAVHANAEANAAAPQTTFNFIKITIVGATMEAQE